MADILIIDDDESVCRMFSRAATRMGHRSDHAFNLQEGLQKTREGNFDLVLLDVQLPDGNGLEAVADILKAPGEPEVFIITGAGDPDGAELATRSGAWAYVEKPPVMRQLTLHMDRALQYREQKISARQPRVMKRDDIVGSSSIITACLEQAALASASDINVVLTGETGTGKDLFARAIHENSRRAGEPFVAVDCASLSETLAKSILFGHVKGAFTGAERDRSGLIREAHGGTLFLDEVGELSLDLQKSFLRVLQEKRFRPVGAEKEIACDFRLIAATNRDLSEMVEKGGFRQDLLYRIRSFSIELPALRNRLADLRELTFHFINAFCEREEIAVKNVSPDFFETLAAYPWPGNVRELANVIESALSVARFEPVLYYRHLPEDIRVYHARREVTGGGASPAVQQTGETEIVPETGFSPENLPTLKKARDSAVEQVEKKYLTELMAVTDGAIPEACRVSGLSRSRLYNLLQKYKIR